MVHVRRASFLLSFFLELLHVALVPPILHSRPHTLPVNAKLVGGF